MLVVHLVLDLFWLSGQELGDISLWWLRCTHLHHLVWSAGWCQMSFFGTAACGCVPLTYILQHTSSALGCIAICVGCMSHVACMTHMCHGGDGELDALFTLSLFLGDIWCIIYQMVLVLLVELCIEFNWIGVLTALTSPCIASPVCMNSHWIMLRKVLAQWTEQLEMGSGPGGCLSCNGWHGLRWDAGRLSASGLSAWSSAPQMEDSGLTLQEILCCVFVSGDFLKPYNI